MPEFFAAAAGFILLTLTLGLLRMLAGPSSIDRLMAVQLVGTSGVAIGLLLAVAIADGAIVDVALSLALLAAVAGAAFVVWKQRELERDAQGQRQDTTGGGA